MIQVAKGFEILLYPEPGLLTQHMIVL